MIEDWYFCAAMRDTPQATHAYLAVLDVLDAAAGVPEVVPEAVERLGRCELWTALHVAPRLLRLAASRGPGAREGLERLLGTVGEVVPDRAVAAPLSALLRGCVQESPQRTDVLLRAAATAWGRSSVTRPTTEAFRDLTRFGAETLLLTVVAQLAADADTRRAVASRLEEEGSPLGDLTARARKHEYGRLPFLLALRATAAVTTGQAEREQLLQDICRPGTGWVQLEPDLMAEAARLLHPDTGQTPEQRVAELDTAAVTMTGLRRLWDMRGAHDSGPEVRRVLDRMGIVVGHVPQAMPAVLWQQTLWDLAADLYPEAAARTLVRRWGAPGGVPSYPEWFSGPVEEGQLRAWANQLESLWRLRTDLADSSVEGRAVRTANRPQLVLNGRSVWAFSPWIDRAQTVWTPGSSAFPAADDPLALLRLTCAARTAVRLMRRGGEPAQPLADLVLHATEVLTDGERGQYLNQLAHHRKYAKDAPVQPGLAPLALTARHTVMYALRGVYPELHPEVFAERAIEMATAGPEQRLYRQAKFLHQQGGALRVLVQAALEALSGMAGVSGVAGRSDAHPQSRWAWGQPRLVERLLHEAAHHLDPERNRGVVGDAMLLLRLLFEHEVSTRRLAESRPSGGGRAVLPRFQEILLAGPQEIDSWQRQKALSAPKVGLPQALSWTTVCLVDGLSGRRGTQSDEAMSDLVDAWAARLDRVQLPEHLPRLTRWHMLRLFDEAHSDDRHQSRILDKLLDVFTEFGLRTPMDQYLLFDRLLHRKLPPGVSKQIRTRLLSLTYAGRITDRNGDGDHHDVWERGMYRHHQRSLERQLHLLMRNLASGDSPEARHDRDFVEQAWQRSVLTSPVHGWSAPLAPSAVDGQPGPAVGDVPDPRTLAAVLAHESAGLAALHWTPVDLEPPLTTDLFRAPDRRDDILAAAAQGRRPTVIGVVCGGTEDGLLLVNCGLGHPIEAPAGDGVGVGDLVSVALVPDRRPQSEHLPVGVEEAPRRLPAALQPGDVRRVHVRLGSREAEITPEDPANGPAGTGPLGEWDPDLSRALCRRAPARGAAHQPGFTALARYETAGWYPVDRGFTELLATRLPHQDGTVAVLTLTGQVDTDEGPAWRFVLAPGQSFVLHERFWEHGSTERLRTEWNQPRDAAGLRCWVRLTQDQDGLPTLALTDPPADGTDEHERSSADGGLDRRNLEWRELCASDTVPVRRSEGRWQVDRGVAGFPAVTVEDMRPFAGDTTDQAVTGWDERAQREATIRARRSGGGPKASLEEFRRLHRVERGGVLRLSGGGRPAHGTLLAWTAGDNVQVEVEADSVLLRPTGANEVWPQALRDRLAVVTLVDVVPTSPGTAARPVAEDELLRHASKENRGEIGRLLRRYDRIEGVLRSAPLPGSGQSPQVWLRVGEHVIDLTVPWSAFTETSRQNGDQVIAFRSDRGWSLRARKRRVRARCLWQLGARGRVRPTRIGMLHGALETPLAVAEREPGVLVPAPGGRTDQQDAGVGGTQVRLSNPFTDRSDGVRRLRAEVVLPNGASVRGDTDVWYQSGTAWQVGSVTLEALPVDDPDGRRWWDVKRRFGLVPAPSTPGGTDLTEAWPHVALAPRWNAALRDGHAILAPVQLDGWQHRVSLPPVPLADGEAPYVSGVRYPEETARVVLRPKPADAPGDLPYVASHRLVQPHRLDGFRSDQGIVEGRETDTSLYFVGVEKLNDSRPNWLRFEWGFGSTLVVHRNDLKLDGRPLRDAQELPLFHGDRATRIVLTRKEGGGMWLDLKGDAISWSDERGLWAQAKERIVPRLTVRLDRAAGTATVLGAESRRRSINPSGRGAEDPGEIVSPRVVLHPNSRAALLRQYPSGPDVVRVLGFLDTRRWEETQGREVVFRHLEPTIRPDDPLALQPGQHVFMWAGLIESDDNDIRLGLSLDVGPVGAPQRLNARVTRRTFAQREDLLRRILQEGGTTALEGTPYLVELRRQRQDQFEGRISNSPPRGAGALLGYLTPRNPSCFAVVTRVVPTLKVELRAGVQVALDAADPVGDSELRVGAVVRITRADDRLSIRTALPSDQVYATPGREVVILPKNPLLTGRQPTKLDMPLFTVSGLPNVELEVAEGRSGGGALPLVRELMSRAHPKTARLRLRKGRLTAEPVPSGSSSAAWLAVDRDTLEASLTPVLPAERPAGFGVTEPARLSFADHSTRRLAERHLAARHRPHDRRTGHWPGGDPEAMVPLDFDGREAPAEPVMPDATGSLRYALDHAERFGFPADYLMTRQARSGAPNSPVGGSAWYVVAGPARRSGRASGLWLELSPGRLVELPGELMRASVGDTLHLLDGLHWELFRPGDEIRLSTYHRNISEPACVVLHEWRPGLRGGLGDAPALLRVLDTDPGSGALRLGGGLASLQYPVTRDLAARSRPGELVRLTPDNRCERLADCSAPAPGDTVLLGLDEDGELFAHGLAGRRVALDQDGWEGQDWLRRELDAGAERATALLSACEDALPVTVAAVEPDGGLRIHRAAMPQLPPDGSWESPARICGRLADGRLVLRSGGALTAARPDELVHGLPAEAFGATATALIEAYGAGATLWLHRGPDGRLGTGLRLPQEPERPATPMAAIPAGAGGVLCREDETGALRWLPAAHAAWAQLTEQQLQDILVAPGTPVRVEVLDDGRASAAASASARGHFRHLRVGDPIRLVLLAGAAQKAPHGRWRYLARLAADDLVVSFSSKSSGHAEHLNVVGEVAALSSGPDGSLLVHTTLRGERGTVPDLPSTIPAAGEPAQRFARYTAVCRPPDPESDAASPALGGHEQLVRAAWEWLTPRPGQELPAASSAVLQNWLKQFVTSGWDATETDLLPLLAAALLSAAEGTARPDRAELAVLLVRHIGERCLRAVHVDPMLGPWLGRERETAGDGLWGRLVGLHITALLEPDDLEKLVAFGRGRQYRSAAEQDPELHRIALGLLASVGDTVPFDLLLEPTGLLTRLAALGRGLVPPRDRRAAQDSLHPGQVAMVAALFEETLRRARPAVLPSCADQRWLIGGLDLAEVLGARQ